MWPRALPLSLRDKPMTYENRKSVICLQGQYRQAEKDKAEIYKAGTLSKDPSVRGIKHSCACASSFMTANDESAESYVSCVLQRRKRVRNYDVIFSLSLLLIDNLRHFRFSRRLFPETQKKIRWFLMWVVLGSWCRGKVTLLPGP